MINMKVSDLEMKVNSIEPRVTEVEKSCSFISYENDNRKKEFESAKAEVLKLKTDCTNMQSDTNYLRERNANLEAKVTDLESRSMRDNLLFYGVAERGQLENCESMIKEVCIENLDLPEALDMKFDRVHRVGTFSNNKVRPIVAKFHNFKDRETVRQKAFENNDALKRANLGIGQQWPSEVRETRKALYPIMQREKAQGKEVRLVKDKLFVNNVQYKLSPQEQYQSQNSARQAYQPRYRTQNPEWYQRYVQPNTSGQSPPRQWIPPPPPVPPGHPGSYQWTPPVPHRMTLPGQQPLHQPQMPFVAPQQPQPPVMTPQQSHQSAPADHHNTPAHDLNQQQQQTYAGVASDMQHDGQ